VKLNEEYDTVSGRTLVDDWVEISYLKKYRNDIDFLSAYSFIRTDTDLFEHILEGEFKNGNLVGLHSKIAENFGGKVGIPIAGPNTEGFYRAYVYKDDGTGNLVQKLNYKGKPVINDMFPDGWTDRQQIIEEISFGASGTRLSPPTKGNQWTGTMSNQKRFIICINGTPPPFNSSIEIKTVWPIF
jgi:hypothetical protein